MLSSGLMAGAVEAFRRRAGGWPGGLREGRECRVLAADSPYRFVFAGGPGAAVREGQRCGYRNGACGVRTIARLRPLCPWSKAPDGLPGGGLRAFFRREAPGALGARLRTACRAGACGRFSAGRLRAPALWEWDVWWRRGPVPEGGRYGKGQGGGFLSSERPGAEL